MEELFYNLSSPIEGFILGVDLLDIIDSFLLYITKGFRVDLIDIVKGFKIDLFSYIEGLFIGKGF